jgi:O-antigen ligase
MLLGFFDSKIGRFSKILLLIAGVVSIATLYYTGSRGGYIGFVMILALFAVKQWGMVKGMMIGAVFLVAAFASAPGRMGDLSPYGASAAGRVNAWIDGLVILKSHPILGVGYQNFPEYVGIAAHSAFIKCMAELGIVGYFFWMALLYTSFMDNREIANGPKTNYSRFAGILQIALIGFGGTAAFLSQTYMPIPYILIALATITANNNEVNRRFPRFLSGSEVWKICLLIGLSIVAYKILAMLYI